ncbi:MAG: cardiolipin synthase [Opitutaceae bacterium]|nr:cardiolipin synthase [Opitutaceae bacterium]MBP9913565.1 cardiolipin synthase [Opitutaceae bacterium]
MNELLEHPFTNAVLPHLLTISGFLLALFLIARLMSEKRQPGNTVAWLLVIVLIPYVGVPLYLVFGGRKLRRLMARKTRLHPTLPGPVARLAACASRPVASTLVACGACAPVGGNQLQLLTTGQEAYAALETAINAAEKNIHITTFILGRDDTGRRLIRLLAKRAKAGVKVRLLLDSVGCMFLSREFYAPLKKAGGEVQWFMPVWPFTSRGSANLRSHRKIAVFDHTTAIVGGHNLAREYMGPTPLKKRWADFSAVIQGPAAMLLNEVFIADWCFTSRQSVDVLHAEIPVELATRVSGDAELQVIASGPDVPGDPLYEGIVSMIQEAEKSITIITPYFIPDDVLQRSLIVKARAGREVTLIVPARSNHPITDFARRYYVRELHKAGVKIMHYQPGMMHSKAIIVDDTLALFGSANIDLRSLFVNFEIGVLIHSPAEVQLMKAWADTLMQSSKLITSEPVRRYRWLSNILEDLSRLFAPLL